MMMEALTSTEKLLLVKRFFIFKLVKCVRLLCILKSQGKLISFAYIKFKRKAKTA